jgi:DNA-binding MarR family transcriptional regulator
VKKADPQEVGRLIASECLSVRVRRLGRVITRIYDAALAPHGVGTAQLNLLAAIAIGGGARPVDLTRLLEVEKSTLSRDLKRMEQLGWVRSRVGPAGAGRLVTLTDAGSRLLVGVRGAWQKAQEAAQAELGRRPFAQLREALPSPLAAARSPARRPPKTSDLEPYLTARRPPRRGTAIGRTATRASSPRKVP